jgi:hypothetical protein
MGAANTRDATPTQAIACTLQQTMIFFFGFPRFLGVLLTNFASSAILHLYHLTRKFPHQRLNPSLQTKPKPEITPDRPGTKKENKNKNENKKKNLKKPKKK